MSVRLAAWTISMLGLFQTADAERVTVTFEAEATTVTGQPFGITVPRLTIVNGYFTYETTTADQSPADLMRGRFFMNGTWDFRAEFLDQVIRGSGIAVSSTNLHSYTLDFNDGGGISNRGVMSINGNPDLDVRMGLSLTGEAKDLPTDMLPAAFTFNPPPGGAFHTFSISDESGSMLLRFRSFRQVRPEILSIRRTGNDVEITWTSEKGKPYALEFSTDLQQWTIIRTNLVGLPEQTTVVDSLSFRYPNDPPLQGFYRILDRPPW